ncbi:MAG: cytochrome-c peroxidase [Planctomycetes bacterium]|nr:cytochrome-c peroxidase [Planctomycetota bacterium]
MRRSSSLVVLASVVAFGGLAVELPRDTLPKELPLAPPYGVVAKDEPAPAPPDARLVELGRALFFAPELSVDGTVSCASCHHPDHGFADDEATSQGVHGRRTARNSPALLNRALGASFFWDGRAATLAEQVLQPIENPDEMGAKLDDVLARLAKDAAWSARFQQAMGGAPTRERLATALASFVSALWHGDTPVDRFQAGDAAALTEEERTGLWIYESKGGCWRCHSGTNFTDEAFHNTGVGVKDGVAEPGREAVTKDANDRGAFKTPTLRGVALTAPYMHDGSLATLKDVVEFYRRGGNANEHLDLDVEKLELTDVEAERLVLFLEALSRRVPGEVESGAKRK